VGCSAVGKKMGKAVRNSDVKIGHVRPKLKCIRMHLC
jgi:hypothetical protein